MWWVSPSVAFVLNYVRVHSLECSFFGNHFLAFSKVPFKVLASTTTASLSFFFSFPSMEGLGCCRSGGVFFGLCVWTHLEMDFVPFRKPAFFLNSNKSLSYYCKVKRANLKLKKRPTMLCKWSLGVCVLLAVGRYSNAVFFFVSLSYLWCSESKTKKESFVWRSQLHFRK